MILVHLRVYSIMSAYIPRNFLNCRDEFKFFMSNLVINVIHDSIGLTFGNWDRQDKTSMFWYFNQSETMLDLYLGL